jgi:guanylate kinase
MDKKIIFVTGVSGSGKTTIINELLMSYSQLVLVPSYTTRPPRPDEKNGRKYWFISQEEFTREIRNNEFLEYVVVHWDYYYGTKIKDIQKVLEMWSIPVKEIDMNGLQKLKATGKLIVPCYSLFFDIPNELMMKRITSRAPIVEKELEHRLASADHERALARKLCDYYIDTEGDITDNMKKLREVMEEIL